MNTIDVSYYTKIDPTTEKSLHEGHIDEFKKSSQAAWVVNGPETVILSKCGCDMDGDVVTYPHSNGKINVLYYRLGNPVGIDLCYETKYAVGSIINTVV